MQSLGEKVVSGGERVVPATSAWAAEARGKRAHHAFRIVRVGVWLRKVLVPNGLKRQRHAFPAPVHRLPERVQGTGGDGAGVGDWKKPDV